DRLERSGARDRDHVDRIDGEPFFAALAGESSCLFEKVARLVLLARRVESASAFEEIADPRAWTRIAELRLDLVEEAMRGGEILAQAVGARNLRKELEALVAERAACRVGESLLARDRVRIFPEGFDVA